MKPIRDPDHFETAFSMTHHEWIPKLLALVRERKLQPRDVLVIYALLSHMNAMTGRIVVRLETIAEEVGVPSSHVFRTFKRLQENLVAVRCKGRTSKGVFFLLNPYYVSVGGKAKQAQLWSKFQEALDNGGQVSESVGRSWMDKEELDG